ncbi:hypothetical protein [Bacillus inaquosorum]|uniref:hypothetical protein n=1 Tax=Bacillus inaquosorum TaxID=483913 RepID=UPI002282DF16|nr:hypothetical protein [Bacillus inaquosorum]MCY8798237.1 hypothetical protein [Bacillus inaquosorum]MEC0772989.1 hypothetical protein [Bacillus inaquosorum]MEC0796962.1 hypothetical protein [Bacillus inaquosorum]
MYKSGSVYLTSKDKEVIDELIEMYFVAINPDEEMEEGMRRIRDKIGGYNSHRRKTNKEDAK